MFVKNVWYMAAWSREVTQDKPLARTLLGQAVVLYRTASGAVHALDDRCPHRAAPLSLGKCVGENLQCMYHGLLFNPQGQCVEQPHFAAPPRLEVRAYPVLEQHNILWIWMGDPALASAHQPVDCHWLSSPKWRGGQGYMHYQAGYELIADNLLDFTHSAYVHSTTFGSNAVAAVKQEVRREGRSVHVTRHLPGIDPVPFHARVGKFKGKVDMWQEYEWITPNVLSMDAGSADAGGRAIQGERDDAPVRFRHLSIITPETEGSTHYFFTQLRCFDLDSPEMDDLVTRQVETDFAEDRQMIEAQHQVIDRSRAEPLKVMGGDRALMEVRKIVDELLAAEQAH